MGGWGWGMGGMGGGWGYWYHFIIILLNFSIEPLISIFPSGFVWVDIEKNRKTIILPSDLKEEFETNEDCPHLIPCQSNLWLLCVLGISSVVLNALSFLSSTNFLSYLRIIIEPHSLPLS
jgi:hypothetical protein